MVNKKLLALVAANFAATFLFSASILNGQEPADAAETQRRVAQRAAEAQKALVEAMKRANIQRAGGPIDRGPTGKYTLGMHCSPIDDRLRGHLQLDESIGLAINRVLTGSPARDAELEEDDILLYADDQAIATQKELAQVVDLAGEEGRSLALTFIRAGEERSTEITPVKRPARVMPERFMPEGFGVGGERHEDRIELRFHPNIIPQPEPALIPDLVDPGIVLPQLVDPDDESSHEGTD